LVAELARHLLVLENPGGGCGTSDGARSAVEAGTVAGAAALEAPALDDALEALTDAGAGHVDQVAGLEHGGVDDVPHVVGVGVVQAQFAVAGENAGAGILAMADLGRVGPRGVLGAEAHLDRAVAVTCHALLLEHHARSGLDYGDGNTSSVVGKYLGHTQLFPNQSLIHGRLPYP